MISSYFMLAHNGYHVLLLLIWLHAVSKTFRRIGYQRIFKKCDWTKRPINIHKFKYQSNKSNKCALNNMCTVMFFREIGYKILCWFLGSHWLVRIFPWNSSINQNSNIYAELKNAQMLRLNVDILFPNKKSEDWARNCDFKKRLWVLIQPAMSLPKARHAFNNNSL